MTSTSELVLDPLGSLATVHAGFMSEISMSSILAEQLFPVSHMHILSGFTTAPDVHIPRVDRIALGDKVLGVHKVSSATTHNIVRPPISEGASNELALEALYPEGSINPGNKSAPPGGFGFYLHGPSKFHGLVRSVSTSEVLMSYMVMFEEGFEWGKGGKLPGLYGGKGDSAYGCTGGRQTDRCHCFDLRLMWREHGVGELYAYLPPLSSNSQRLLAVPPRSIQHPDYGFSVGRGAWCFVPGRWTAIAQRVKMNEVGLQDGEIELFVDGKSVIRVSGLTLREGANGEDSTVQGLHVQTFFGGHTEEWRSPKDQRAWFTSISGAILGEPKRGHDEL